MAKHLTCRLPQTVNHLQARLRKGLQSWSNNKKKNKTIIDSTTSFTLQKRSKTLSFLNNFMDGQSASIKRKSLPCYKLLKKKSRLLQKKMSVQVFRPRQNSSLQLKHFKYLCVKMFSLLRLQTCSTNSVTLRARNSALIP
jgi:hypothetical protein